jgi:PHD/YefM family antitoxin component YafN of YafNO toxin-antitoxin module
MGRDPYNPQVVVKNGKPASVIINIDDYEWLLEQAEQKQDLKALRRLKKRGMEFVSFNEYLRKKDAAKIKRGTGSH